MKTIRQILDKLTGRDRLKVKIKQQQQLLTKRSLQVVQAAKVCEKKEKQIKQLNNELLESKLEISILKNANNVGLQLD